MSPSSPVESSEHVEPLSLETSPVVNSVNSHVPNGLVPAGELPSAADVLAQLFPPDESGAGKKDKSSPSHTSIFGEEDAFPYVSSLPPFDPYSLSAEMEARLAEPASTRASESPAAADLDSQSIDIGKTKSEEKSAQNASAAEESSDELQEAAEPEIAVAPSARESSKRRKRRGKASFRRLATGIREFLGASRAKGKSGRHVSSVSAQTGEAATAPVPEAMQDAAAVEATSPIAAGEKLIAHEIVADALLVAAENLQQDSVVESAEISTGAGEIIASAAVSTSEALAAHAEVAQNVGAPASLSAPQESAPEMAEASSLDHLSDDSHSGSHADSSATGSSSVDRDAAEQHANFFSEDASHEPAQPIEPSLSAASDSSAEEGVDSSDDDQAIAAAIDRYANTTAAAAAEAELLANGRLQQADFAPDNQTPDSLTHGGVDINAVLDIPRDPEPAQTLIPSAGLFSPAIAGAEAFALSESTMPAARTVESVAAELPLANIPAHELPEPNSASHLSTTPYRDWSFEEKIASHHEWLESKGSTGKKADLTGADLEGSDLIGVDLRFVDLHDANLRAADLLMADLRDACLVRANFRDACLVGANLEAANLESASLETAMGLVPRQLAGANLHEATLPASVQQFEALAEFKRTARRVHGYFVALMSMSVISALLIWMTKDYQLLTNSAVLFFLHSPAAAAALPTVQFYLIAPMALFILYLVLQFHLQHLWDLVLELPAVFPDGHALGENEPRIVVGLLRAHFRWLNADAPSTRFVEKGISMLLAYWIVPLTLLLYWARFLTLQQFRGTVLQELLVATATGVALYSSTKVGKPGERWMLQENFAEKIAGKLRGINPVTPGLVVLGVLMYLAAGTMMGVPHSKERAPQFMAGSIRRWAPTVLWTFGIDPYADLTEAVISRKPANWNGSDAQVASVTGAPLNGANFRYAQAYRAFLANAHLLHANLQGAFLSQADLRGAEMGQANLKYAVLDQAQMNHVNLDRATLTGANLSRADLRSANLSYALMSGAALVDAHLDSATLYGANLTQSTLIRTDFEKADLRESHLEAANLEHVDMQGAYLWSAKLMGARLTNAELQKAIFVDADLHGADLRWAHLSETVLTGADLTGAYLDGADLRGAVGFGANQICSAKSRHGLLLDDAMQMQVASQCGAGN